MLLATLELLKPSVLITDEATAIRLLTAEP